VAGAVLVMLLVSLVRGMSRIVSSGAGVGSCGHAPSVLWARHIRCSPECRGNGAVMGLEHPLDVWPTGARGRLAKICHPSILLGGLSADHDGAWDGVPNYLCVGCWVGRRSP
jgi:hypothetical protein